MPHGGYLLALITTAIGHLQADSKPYHPDPAHLTATFLRPAKKGKIEIHINKLKTGRNWTNFETKLYQGVSCVSGGTQRSELTLLIHRATP